MRVVARPWFPLAAVVVGGNRQQAKSIAGQDDTERWKKSLNWACKVQPGRQRTFRERGLPLVVMLNPEGEEISEFQGYLGRY